MWSLLQGRSTSTSWMQQFFNLLSSNGNKPVDLETFVVGCIKLKGAAKSMDLMDLVYMTRETAAQHREEQCRFEAYCRREFDAIKRGIGLPVPGGCHHATMHSALAS